MRRYAMLLEYEGGRFKGFQYQGEEIPTVQLFLERVLRMIAKEEIRIHCAGRTDTGVHALGQVVHFESDFPFNLYKLRESFNFYGREWGAAVLEIKEAPSDFHSRFSALERSYCYVICNRPAPSALFQKRMMHVPQALHVEAMKEAAEKLLGTHDFESFRASECQASHARRTLDECTILKKGDFLFLKFRARSFLHNQVRITVGTLINIGLGKKPPSWIDELLMIKDRSKAGPTAPAHGLYFLGVRYAEPLFETHALPFFEV